MLRKQNRDPNQSTRTSYNQAQKKISNTNQHNNSINTISSTQQQLLKQFNKNSQILAEIKQSKQLINSKQFKQTNNATKTNLSTTRSNYKPKFILKDLMQQKQSSSHQHQNDSQSMCEDYFMPKPANLNNLSNTFNNSPLASQAYYKFNAKQPKVINNASQIIQSRNKSVILSKRNYLEDQSKKNDEYQKTKHYDLPVQIKPNMKKTLKTQENHQYDQSSPQFYQQASTVQYNKKISNKAIDEGIPLSFQPRVRSISTNLSSHTVSHTGQSNSPKNYKMAYLQTKKELQIRSAYFNEAIQLCRHIIGNMKSALEEQYCEAQSDKVMWCHQRCENMLQVFNQWKKE